MFVRFLTQGGADVKHYRWKKRKVVLLLAIFWGMIMAGSILVRAEGANGECPGQKRYATIEIKSGDTLWNIACHYAPESMTIKAYIRELMELNRLTDSRINSGQHLIVFYSREQ